MRPVERGPVPQQPNGQPKRVGHHRDWCADLLRQLGPYCSYCNMPLDSPQVEHVVAQASAGGQAVRLSWDNLLLACGACNRAKWHYPCSPATHALPDAHDTHLAFTHREVPHPQIPGKQACIVEVRPGLTAQQHAKAVATLQLCQLHHVPTKATRIKRASDVRWQRRLEALVAAKDCRQIWNGLPATMQVAALGLIKQAAQPRGFFSVWMDVFDDVPAVKQMLVDQATFPNTAACFPAPTYDPVPRIPGDL